MHAVGLHSALAIKRQRKRRDEQKRARERRYSTQSGESGLTSPRASSGSLDRHSRHHRHQAHQVHRAAGQGMLDSKVVTSIGMLHIGVVFLVLGGFLLASGLLPGDLATWSSKNSGGWWNELVATGIFALVIGIFLVILNRIIAKKEENDLEEYVQRQLTRSKSGHRLERDVETGGLTTRHARKARQLDKLNSCSSVEITSEKTSGSPPRSPPPAYSPPPLLANGATGDQHQQSALFLEQITEEEMASDRLETSTTNSPSPGSPSETRELLYANSGHYKHNGNHNHHNHNHNHNHHHHHHHQQHQQHQQQQDHRPIYVHPTRN